MNEVGSHSNRPAPRKVLLGCYFTRSVELEGVGSLLRELCASMTQWGYTLRTLSPVGGRISEHVEQAIHYRPGPLGIVRYRDELRRHSAWADAVILIENNPNMAFASTASQCPRTWCVFLTPLQNLRLFKEMGLGRQAWLHTVGKHELFSRLGNWIDKRCIVSSDYQARQLRRLGARDVQVVRLSGVGALREVPSRSEARRRLNWDERPVVGYLGHFSRAKGVDVLVEAFCRHDCEAVLALAHSGKGRLTSLAQSKLDELTALSKVRMEGVVDPLTFLSACDVVALPYITSSIFHHPQVLFESIAAGTAVITTSVGGVAEVVEPGVTGCIVAPRDASQLGLVINQCLKNLQTTHRMGKAAQEAFVREFTCQQVTQKLHNIIFEGNS